MDIKPPGVMNQGRPPDNAVELAASPESLEFARFSDIVTTRLRSEILSGKLAAGEKIDQVELARRLGISRTPIREALKRLEAEGLVDMSPHRGAIAAPLSAADLESIYTARILLEGFAARVNAPRMTPADVTQMRAIFEEMHGRIASNDIDGMMSLNDSFHSCVYGAAREFAGPLVELMRPYWTRAQRYRLRYAFLPGRAAQIEREHEEMLHACFERDGKRADRAVRRHLANVAFGILEEIDPEHEAVLLKSAVGDE